MKPKIIPAILPKTIEELKIGLQKIKSFAQWVQIDIADDIFVKNKTVNLQEIDENKEILNLLKKFKVEFHLMVANPLSQLKAFHQIKPERVYFHYEAIKKEKNFIKNLSSYNFEVGLAINPPTKIEELTSFIDNFNSYLFLTVNPGFQGQPFIKKVIEKIKLFKKIYFEKKVSVDGGVNQSTILFLKEIDLESIIVGSFIIKSLNPQKNFQFLIKTVIDK